MVSTDARIHNLEQQVNRITRVLLHIVSSALAQTKLGAPETDRIHKELEESLKILQAIVDKVPE